MKKVRVWLAVAAIAAALGVVFVAGPGNAGDDDAAVKAAREDVMKIAAAVKGGDLDGAKKMAAAAAKKHELEYVMTAFKRKDKGGTGFGTGPKETDGIEAKYREVARDGAKAKDMAFFEAMAHTTIAVGLIAEAKTPEKDKGKGTVKGWKTANQEMIEGAQALAKAAKAKGAGEIKTAASKVNNACNACHAEWRN